MFRKKRKIDLTVKKRTPDYVPFKIPKPTYDGEIPETDGSFVSPVYGNDVSDEIVVNRKVNTNIHLYDPFREKPLKEQNSDDLFPEFRKIPKRHKPETPEKKEIKETKVTIEVKEVIEEKPPTLYKYERKEEVIPKEEEKVDDKIDIGVLDDLFGIEKKPKEEINIKTVDETSFLKADEKESQKNNIENTITYKFPPISFLQSARFDSLSDDVEWNNRNINILNKTLQDFKIDGEVKEYTQGPTVTRYSIILGSGVSGGKIESISNDIQRSLSATSVRIENPVPGTSYVGIEVPNKKRRTVTLKELISTDLFTSSIDPLLIPVGLDVEGKPKYTSIEKLPHALVAGGTGSGKSVFLYSAITSILFKCSPNDVKFLFIDPKKVDLQQFNGIPHLIAPIVSDTKEAVLSLKWLVDEMERRLTLFQHTKTINIADYKKRAVNSEFYRNMPRIVVVIEEAGDFLMTGGTEAEDTITRLTQKARAAGIHVILAMQKPIAKQLPSTIKTNAGGRFAFKVNAMVDSMVILDTGGAETLLGNGDMMFSSQGTMARYQSAFISPEEIEKVCDFCASQMDPQYEFNPEELEKKSYSRSIEELDSAFEDVLRYVVRERKCSINAISNEFSMGFNRTNAIVDSLERYGAIGPNVGTKPREVFLQREDIEDFLNRIKA